ncbi:MAG TPA: hypothetical protein VJQ52_02955 [Steroidobacteraceae bacterium]|nr:hypothetical protein [Steroidobacteraceae bacterium]
MSSRAVRRLQQLDDLVNKVVCEAELIRDYVQLRFQGDTTMLLHNDVALDGQTLSNSAAGRTLLASLVGRTVLDVARAADELVLSFRCGRTLTMSLQRPSLHSPEALVLVPRASAAIC